MSVDPEDPHCPECGEPIGQTATYCMHCSAEFTGERAAADRNGDGYWDGSESDPSDVVSDQGPGSTTPGDPRGESRPGSAESGDDEQLLDPDGMVDDTLTVVVGIAGGVVVGAVGTLVLVALTGSGAAILFGLCAWLGSTAYLVRRRTVQEAIATGSYAVAVVLLAVPVIAFSPLMDVEGGVGERLGVFLVLVLFVAVPAGVAAVIGWVASRYTTASDGRPG